MSLSLHSDIQTQAEILAVPTAQEMNYAKLMAQKDVDWLKQKVYMHGCPRMLV